MKKTTILTIIIIPLIFLSACTQKADVMEKEPIKEKPMEVDIITEEKKPQTPAPTPKQETKTNTIVMVVAPKDFKDVEFFTPLEIFEAAGYEVLVASTIAGEVFGLDGGTYMADIELSDIDPNNLDAIVISGGGGVLDHLWNDPILMDKINAVANENKIVSALCLSPGLLAQAGVLDSVSATVCERPPAMKAFEDGNVNYTADSVTTDGNIVTGNGPKASADFANAVLKAIDVNQ